MEATLKRIETGDPLRQHKTTVEFSWAALIQRKGRYWKLVVDLSHHSP